MSEKEEQLKKDFPKFFNQLGRIPTEKELEELNSSINPQNTEEYTAWINKKGKEGENVSMGEQFKKKEEEKKKLIEEGKLSTNMKENPSAMRPDESEQQFAMRMNDNRIERKADEDAILEKEAEKAKAKDIQIEAGREQRNKLYEQSFMFETEAHKPLREDIYKYSRKGDMDKVWAIRAEYAKLNYVVPDVLEYIPIPMLVYEIPNLGIRFESRDNGETWKVIEEYPSGITRRPLLENGELKGFQYDLMNDGLYGLLGGYGVKVNVYCRPYIESEHPITPKIAVPQKKYNCEDQEIEHVYQGKRCVLCGYVKQDKR